MVNILIALLVWLSMLLNGGQFDKHVHWIVPVAGAIVGCDIVVYEDSSWYCK